MAKRPGIQTVVGTPSILPGAPAHEAVLLVVRGDQQGAEIKLAGQPV